MIKRYHCSICYKKRNQSELIRISSDLHKKAVWACKNHTSSFADVSHIRPVTEKPVFLELFSGSGHISKYAESIGFEVFNLDFQEKFKPSICGDILKVKTGQFPKNVLAVWASLPCTVYSVMSLSHHWTKICIGYRQYYYIPKSKEAIQALRILHKTLSIIAELNPVYYFIENPRGALRHFPQMKMIPYRHTVSYADYGFDYYKPTDIFTNCKSFKPIKIKGCMGVEFETSIKDLPNAYERSLIPPGLIAEVFDSFKNQFLLPGSVGRPVSLASA